ncbi:MAG: glycoside hydrolase family 30 protein [bacterium]
MERKRGLWMATTPERQWGDQGRPGTTRRVEPGLRFDGTQDQLWEGFGGCFNELGWIALSTMRGADRGRVIQALFDREDGCRFNLCRVPIGASDYALEWYSCNETDGDLGMSRFTIERDRQFLIPYIRAALRLQPMLKLFASPWSPPVWMKHPRAYHSGKLIWKPEILEAYALYFARFVQAYRQEGIQVHQVHVQNEPVADPKFPGCLWTGPELRDFIRNHLGPMFAKQRVRSEIWLGTLNTDDYNGYTLTALSDPLARQFIAGVGYQGAGKAAVLRTHTSWPETRMMQTENECGDGQNSWAYARYVFGLLQHYISCGVNAYVYWNMVLQPGGGSTWGWRENSMITVDPLSGAVTFNPEFYVMKHFSHFIDRNAIRLGLTGGWAGNAVAFMNPDESRVLVLQNPFAESRRVVLEDGSTLLTLNLPPESFHTVVL